MADLDPGPAARAISRSDRLRRPLAGAALIRSLMMPIMRPSRLCRRKIEMSPGAQSRDDTLDRSDDNQGGDISFAVGHVRQAGGDSRLKLRRRGYSGAGGK